MLGQSSARCCPRSLCSKEVQAIAIPRLNRFSAIIHCRKVVYVLREVIIRRWYSFNKNGEAQSFRRLYFPVLLSDVSETESIAFGFLKRIRYSKVSFRVFIKLTLLPEYASAFFLELVLYAKQASAFL